MVISDPLSGGPVDDLFNHVVAGGHPQQDGKICFFGGGRIGQCNIMYRLNVPLLFR